MGNNYIFTMWWQGLTEAPIVVKLCIESIRRNKGNCNLVIIDSHNYDQYVKLPDYIIEKFNKGLISATHFSDMIRFYLIYHYGGLWIDATVFISNEIDYTIFEEELFLYTYNKDFSKRITNRWSTFVFGAKANNPIVGSVLNMMLSYWKKNDTLVHYLWIDLFLYIGYQKNYFYRDMLNSQQENLKILALDSILNKEFNLLELQSLFKKSTFHKLTWKKPYDLYVDDNIRTNFSYLLNSYSLEYDNNLPLLNDNKYIRKIRNFKNFIIKNINLSTLKQFGFKILCLNILSKIMQRSENFISRKIYYETDKMAIEYLEDKFSNEIAEYF